MISEMSTASSNSVLIRQLEMLYVVLCSFHHAPFPLDLMGGNVSFFDNGITRSSCVGGGEVVPSRYPSKI